MTPVPSLAVMSAMFSTSGPGSRSAARFLFVMVPVAASTSATGHFNSEVPFSIRK